MCKFSPFSNIKGSRYKTVFTFTTVCPVYHTVFSRKGKKKSAYRHVPHSEKPAHLVAKRNARERRRVEAVNAAFVKVLVHY